MFILLYHKYFPQVEALYEMYEFLNKQPCKSV